MTCPICDYAREHGSWPPDHRGTHCSDSIDGRGRVVVSGCHRSWASKAQSHCTLCHRHFGSDSAGDSHRFGDYRGGGEPVCRDPRGFDRWETPNGPIWGGRDPDVARERMAEIRAFTGSVVTPESTERRDGEGTE
jgi:hypothetical protein